MTTPSSILIFGATGVIGKFIIEQLIAAKSNFSRIAIFTSRGTVENKKDEIGRLKEQGVEVVVGDVTNESDVRKAFEGKSVACCRVNGSRWKGAKKSVRLCLETVLQGNLGTCSGRYCWADTCIFQA